MEDKQIADKRLDLWDIMIEGKSVWLTQAQLCELYQTSKSIVSENIESISMKKES